MIKILILSVLLLMSTATAETDCLTHALTADEPIMLIGVHPFFYGSTSVNHFVNYKQIDNRTLEIHDYMYDLNYTMSGDWDEIRPGVYYDGFNYFKMFLYREPQRYWRRMI